MIRRLYAGEGGKISREYEMPILLSLSSSADTAVTGTEVYAANTLIAIAAVIAVAAALAYFLRRANRDLRAPRISDVAVVLSKRQSVLSGKSVTSAPRCKVEFRLSDGSLREFRTPPADFGKLEPDETGILTFRGSQFVSFERFED
ncbi:MAG: DUF2500 domain-containing protein [Oscillospiraceae bacterium]|nr:DUF2500 domain-containing protein [Oscillospiraceae bacterium]